MLRNRSNPREVSVVQGVGGLEVGIRGPDGGSSSVERAGPRGRDGPEGREGKRRERLSLTSNAEEGERTGPEGTGMVR